MSYSVADVLGLLLAAALTGPMLVLPGHAIARVLGWLDEGSRTRRDLDIPLALVAACGLLPVLDSLGARFIGIVPTLVAHVALAVAGASILRQRRAEISRGMLIAAIAWLCIVAFAWVDIDWNGSLHQSILIKDMVKHAATVRAMADQASAPPADVFFLREQAAGYYYFYYVLPAMVETAGLGLIDSRAAVGGHVYWTGLTLVSLALVLLDRTRLASGSVPRVAHVVIALVAAAGLEMLLMALVGGVGGIWHAQIAWWKEAVGAFVHSILWVPHHVSAVIATWAGLLVLAPLADRTEERLRNRDWIRAGLAGAAFATALGLSVWVTLGSVAIAGLWGASLLAGRNWRGLAALAAAGGASLVLSLPDLSDMLANRAYDGFPIAFGVRPFPFEHVIPEGGLALTLARLAWLPVNITLGFGVLLVGSIAFWRRRGWRLGTDNEIARLLVLSALAGLLISSFFQSTIVNNDLGWRVLLFAQVASLVWTASVAAPLWRSAVARLHASRPAPRLAYGMLAALVLGLAGTTYEIVAMRASYALGLRTLPRSAGHEAIDREVREAYDWANRAYPRNTVLQHNPEETYLLGFGLYGRLPVAVAPSNLGTLFGAPREAVSLRLADIAPVFNTTLDAAEVKDRLGRHGIDLVLVTAADEVWMDPRSWVWKAQPEYATQRLRIVAAGRVAR